MKPILFLLKNSTAGAGIKKPVKRPVFLRTIFIGVVSDAPRISWLSKKENMYMI